MSDLRLEKLSLLIGTMLGQMSELLNIMTNENPNIGYIYNSLQDIVRASSLHVNELYYKGNKPETEIENPPEGE